MQSSSFPRADLETGIESLGPARPALLSESNWLKEFAGGLPEPGTRVNGATPPAFQQHLTGASASNFVGTDVIPKQDDVVIAVMGVTGAGKTSFIQHFSSVNLNVGHGLESCVGRDQTSSKWPVGALVTVNNDLSNTFANSHLSEGTSSVYMVPCQLMDGRRLFLVDTPGFDDTYRTDVQVLNELAQWLSETYQNHIQLTGIIYLHRITDVRIGGSGMKNLRMFRKLCGIRGLGSVVLGTTMWSLCPVDDAQRREDQLVNQNDLWKSLVANGARVFRQDNGQQSALQILNYLMDRARLVTLDIQHEMVDQGLALNQTGAGKEVQAELDKLKEEHKRELAEIRHDMEEAMKQKDKEREDELREYKELIEKQERTREEESEKLEATYERLRREMRQQYEDEMRRLSNRQGPMQPRSIVIDPNALWTCNICRILLPGAQIFGHDLRYHQPQPQFRPQPQKRSRKWNPFK